MGTVEKAVAEPFGQKNGYLENAQGLKRTDTCQGPKERPSFANVWHFDKGREEKF